jgi:uncharacterized LabA/DUF88 family protein
MKMNVYIDSFNLYYGCLKKNPSVKWLDISKLCSFLFPKDDIQKINYYTAAVKLRPNDPDTDKPNRQQIYFRALRTLPNAELIYGSFLSHTVSMKRADGKGYVDVIKTEEKGTDVNIATHLVHDAHNKSFEIAVVISNDSDLVEPIRIVTQELRLPVIVVSPFERNSIELKKIASSVRHIRQGVLKVSQFPNILEDDTGQFTKPSTWK